MFSIYKVPAILMVLKVNYSYNLKYNFNGIKWENDKISVIISLTVSRY